MENTKKILRILVMLHSKSNINNNEMDLKLSNGV